ncbi:MAG: HAD family hydrolase [Chthoniobacterales bacterium]
MTTTSEPVRIAMWSGPRNISTAMMRAWGNRADTLVMDEPLYAYYLERTGKRHPGAEEVIATGETDWRKVAAGLTKEPIPSGKRIFFQKHMTHHLLPEVGRQWIVDLTNCFLIRDPREVILSYIKKNPDPALEDLGFVQQCELFDFVVGTSRRDVRNRHSGSERRSAASLPPVIDASDVLQNPECTLRLLCEAIGVEFDKAMLTWPPGLRETDGIWAKHWYAEVAESTSFQPYKLSDGAVPERLRQIEERCRECYERLYEHRLGAGA